MARRPATLDPITLEILWTRLVSIVDEAAATHVRSSFSSMVRDSNDYAVVLTDIEGRALAQSSLSIPAFIGTLPETVKHFIARFSLATMRPGDVFVTNDPWVGTGHIHDINIVMPLFDDRRRPVAFAAIASHMPDIGGRIRGPGNRDVFEEGLQIPMLRLVRAGRVDAAVVAFIERNNRVPEQTMGDVWGEVAACRLVEDRIKALLRETDVDLARLGAEVRGRAEAAMRAAIRTIPDGEYSYRVEHDGFEAPIVIACRITVAEGSLAIDYAGSSAQLPYAVNVVPRYAFAYSAFGVKALLCPEVPNNEGCFVPLTTTAPAGSIFNPVYPAATGARGMIGHLLPPAIMGALAGQVPTRVLAEGSGNSVITLAGTDGGRPFAAITFVTAGQGASADHAGLSAICFPSNVANTPMEVLERITPVIVHERRIRRGSGGAGRHVGGDGVSFELEYRGDSDGVCSFIVTRMRVPPAGMAGGGAGETGALMLNGTPILHDRQWVLKTGDRIRLDTAGGGGFGAA